MRRMKPFLSKVLYRVAMFSKPLVLKIIPFETRQIIKQKLLKSAFPIKKRMKEESHEMNGVNLVGYARAEMGIGESCRIAANSISTTGIPFGIINFIGTNLVSMNDKTWIHKEISRPEYNVNIFHINAEQMMEVYAHYGNQIFEERYNIGYWHWELPDFPDEWSESYNFLDEIWVPSTFVADSISIKSPIPVVKIPHSIEVKIKESRDRVYFGLPEKSFLFLTMYDMKSYQERKNPLASIFAFQKAFEPNDFQVGLVVKVNSSEHESEELNRLRELIGNYQNIYLIQKTLTRNDTNALISVTNCYISLHRSEGFGLGLAEAMYLGKPVIGTNWSSNTDFMNKDNSCLVDYQLTNLKSDHGPYKSYQYWADPDIEHASTYMKKLYTDKEFYTKIASNGKKYIHQNLSPKVIGELINKRLKYISSWEFGG